MRWLRRLGWGLLGVLLLWGTSWLALPPLLKWQGQLRLSEVLGRQVAIERIDVEPWALVLRVEGLTIGPAAGSDQPALLQLSRLRIDAAIDSLRQRAPVIEAIEIDGLDLRLTRTAEGHYDIDDLLQRFSPEPGAPPSGEPPRFALNNLQLRDARLRFEDRPVDRVHQVDALQLSLPFLSNLPSKVDLRVEPRLAFRLGSTVFDTGAQATPFAKTRSADLRLSMKALDLAPYLPYLPASLPVKLQAGELGAELALRFSQPEGGHSQLALSGQLQARRMVLTDRQDAALLRWEQLELVAREVQPLARQVALDLLQVDGLQLHLSRDASGLFNWAQLAGNAAPTTPARAAAAKASAAATGSQPSSAGPAASPWQLALGRLALNEASVYWRDATTRPAAALQLDGLSFSAESLRWPSPQAVPLRLATSLRRSAEPAKGSSLRQDSLGQIGIDGEASPSGAQLTVDIAALNLAGLAPYVAQHLVPALAGELALKARLDWQAEGQKLAIALPEASLDRLRLSTPGPVSGGPGQSGTRPAGTELLSLKKLSLAGLQIDWPAQQLSLAKLSLQQPVVQLARHADGRLNVADWLVPAAPSVVQASTSTPVSTTPPWQVSLKDGSVQAGQLSFSDALAGSNPGAPPLQLQVAGLKLGVQNLQWRADKPAPAMLLQVAARVGAAPSADEPRPASGSLDWSGQLGLSPLLARGSLRAERLPVQVLEPYFGHLLPLALVRAEAGYLGEIDLSQLGADWRVSTRGDLLLGDVQVNARTPDGSPGEELLNWQRLALDGLQFSQTPGTRPQLLVRESTLSDFYSRLVITEQGRFNLQDVGAAAPADAASSPQAADPPRAIAASAPAASASGAAGAPQGLPIDLQLGPTRLVNGRVDFTDRFVRPNYSAELSELNGQLGAFRSGSREMASLSLRGRAAGTALLDISGALNPTAEPLALDIRARATDLELAPLSPYAGKYAGYAIERGKLSLDVAYKIDPDGKLDAKNQVVLNQLTFGERIESPQATKLPVLLAVALLKDRQGVIDINLPVSGSVNDPQFSVGGLIVRLIVNLLGKALTAPFALLAGGGSDDLSLVEFSPGTASISPGSQAVLDKVAKALGERPALKMTVTGAADPASEAMAYRQQALEARLQAERRRELLRTGPGTDTKTSSNVETAADRERLLRLVYRQTALPNKPKNLVGMVKDIPAAEMETLLRAQLQPSPDALRELALQRGLAVRDALIARGLPSERLFLAAPKLRAATETEAGWTPRVQLSLSAQ